MLRYTAGEMDWFAHGLAREGAANDEVWDSDLAEGDVPTCNLGEKLGRVQDTIRESTAGVCVVVNNEQVVLGLLRKGALDLNADPDIHVEQIMECGPRTVRPYEKPEHTIKSLKSRDSVLVTTSDGVLLGLLTRERVEDYLAGKRATKKDIGSGR